VFVQRSGRRVRRPHTANSQQQQQQLGAGVNTRWLPAAAAAASSSGKQRGGMNSCSGAVLGCPGVWVGAMRGDAMLMLRD
jgi:hypothetical protein